MMGQDTMGRNMMGPNVYNLMSNRGMTSDVSNVMGQDSQMLGRKILGHQDMTPNTMYSNMIGQDMMDKTNNRMSSNMINSHGMTSDMMNAHSNNGLMGQRMMQKMEIEHVPEIYTSTRFF